MYTLAPCLRLLFISAACAFAVCTLCYVHHQPFLRLLVSLHLLAKFE